jgi:hypothetical protein
MVLKRRRVEKFADNSAMIQGGGWEKIFNGGGAEKVPIKN